jgi:putative transcriptional regulator
MSISRALALDGYRLYGLEFLMPIKNRIAELRRARDWSQQTLAERAQCSLSSLQKIEQGQWDDPSLSIALKLSAALDVQVNDIFFDENSPHGLELEVSR